jgi:DNA helicase II / ATP-dependent DNA helicase PcrA
MDFFKKFEKNGINFSENQKAAITHVNGPLLVVSGPGSGKTSVITARTAFLVQQGKINPSNILVITFTRAAANEMKQRFKSLPGTTQDHIDKVEFGTFHSTFYKIINSYYGRQLPVLEQGKAYTIIKNILKSLCEPYDDEIVENTLNDISLSRTVKHKCEFKSEHFKNSVFLSICSQYEKGKKDLKCIDFDDMLIMSCKILENDNNLLQGYRNRYKYFLIDEFQDTNEIQLDIIKLLSDPLNNLCVVGDDDQSIYGFRGSMPRCLIDFEENFKESKTVHLDINYRSTKEIIDISKKIISFNIDRKGKDLKPYRGSGRNPLFISPPNEEMEASFISDTVRELKIGGYSYKDFAVLYRVNIQSRPVIDELIKENIPFNVKDSINNFYNHWICRDLSAYLKLSIDMNDIASLVQIINKPVRYISKEWLEKVLIKFSHDKFDLNNIYKNTELKDFQQQKLNTLFDNLKTFRFMTPSSAVNFIRKLVSYDDYIRNYCMELNIEISDFYDILDEYEISSSQFNTIPEFLSHINEVSLKLKDCRNTGYFKKDGITLSTIHGAKGLEFPCVFIIGVVDGLLPHKKSTITGENIEEERRLFYVAATRSKDVLFISSPKRHHNKSTGDSRFIKELLENDAIIKNNNSEIHKFNTAEYISHKIFGTGKIININKNILEIQFNNRNGIKKLDINTCIQNKLIDKV